ncbi:MAG: pyridoxal phosphate-dependent aminotransferase [Candidatus Geothermarchaeales archaeon]
MSRGLCGKVLGVPASGIVTIRDMKLTMTGVVGLESGDPDFDTPVHVKEAAVGALRENFTHYTPNSGIVPLREAIAKKLKEKNGMETNANTEIMVTTGGMGALFTATQAVLSPGDEVLVPDPYWTSNMMQILMAGGKGVSVPLEYSKETGFRLDPDSFMELITDRTRAIVINTPHNPTGMVASKEQLKALAEIAQDHDLYVFSDEPYEDIVYDGARHYSIGSFPGMKERTITAFSLSKTYAMTGWRIGYLAAPREIIEQAYKVQLYSVNGVNAIAQKAALAALEGPHDFLVDMVAEYKRRRDMIVERLNSIKIFECWLPQGAFYVFPRLVDVRMTSMEFVKFLLREGKMATTPGSIFGERGEGFVRFAYSFSFDYIQEAMDRIEGAILGL